MASSGQSLESLSDQQRAALEQFTAVTAQDANDAIPLLTRCEWNVQIAIARFFDGEPPPEPEPVAPAPDTVRRQETLLNTIPTSTSRPLAGARHLSPAPRIVGTPESQLNAHPPLLLSLSLAPLNMLLGVFSRLYSIVSTVAPFIPMLISRIISRLTSLSPLHASGARRPDLGPQATADRFIRDFKDTYGEHPLPLLGTSYARAYDTAKSELKFLLVIPLSPEHQHTDAFVRGVLLSEPVSEYICNSLDSMLVWAGSTADAETFSVASALGVTQFPAAILIAHTPSVSATAMSIVTRISGSTTPAAFRAAIDAAVQQHSAPLARARAARNDQQATRSLREEQQTAYERSLAKDRERVRRKREAEQAEQAAALAEKAAAERAAQHADALRRWRAWRAARIAPEPPQGAPGAARISVRMLDGTRMVRRFAGAAPLEELYALVECHGADAAGDAEKVAEPPAGFTPEYGFRLVEVMPRRVYELAGGGTIGERLGRGANLVAERIEEGDDEGDGRHDDDDDDS